MRPTPLALVLSATLAFLGCYGEGKRGDEMPRFPDHKEIGSTTHSAANADPSSADIDEFAVQAKAPPISEGYFPCSDCHADMETNRERRELEDEHDSVVLKHGTRERWCFDCHDPDNRDELRLASGTKIPFEKSYRLCGQCHGPKLRDWRAGVHGKRTGKWNGEKEYLLCVHCHNPHAPLFAPLVPKRRPRAPHEITFSKD
ncbi:MAG: cytochrome c3 family protein [Deltaproteobacteria bacterium]|nr:cytochrome c3 family protein [Deltaproteobacteria bacterium]